MYFYDGLKEILFKVCQNKSFYMNINNENNVPENIYSKYN